MDLNEIAIFLKVIQLGSFSQAAKQLQMPNSTVSSKVSSLEKRLGVTLIQRTTRKLNITPAGETFYKKCLLGLEEIRAAESEITSLKGEPQGQLRLTAPVELGSSVLPSLISQFIKKYPKVSVEVIFTDRRVDLLSEGVDLAIRAGALKDSSLIAKKVGSAYFSLFASPKYLKNFGTPTHPRELKDHACLHFSPLGTGAWTLVGPKGTLEIPVKSSIIMNDMLTLRSMAAYGDGIVLLPSHFCVNEIKSGKLVRILSDWKTAPAPVHFVYPAQKFVTPKLSAFIAFATEPIRETFMA